MISKILLLATATITALLGVLLKDFIVVVSGIGRTYNRIEEYPYECRRLEHPLLESCEDLVIDTEGRRVYVACSTAGRQEGWAPNGDKFNVSARELKDHVSVLSLDTPDLAGLFNIHTLQITGDYQSSSGGRDIDLLGLDIEVLSDSRLRFWLVNARPPVDRAGNSVDATVFGANSTIEVFELTRGELELEFVKTIVSDAIVTPNNLVATSNGGVMFTNDHSAKVGMSRALEMVTGGGTVAFCPTLHSCHTAAKGIFKFPNGIIRDRDGLYYVANTLRGEIDVLELRPDNTLRKINEISIGMMIDNLSIDSNGDIFVPGFPSFWGAIKGLWTPGRDVPATIFRIRKVGEREWEIEKVLEDIEGKYISFATSVAHDVKTGNFFFGSITSPFVTVCEKRH